MSVKKFEIIVALKPEVLDPQGRAIQETLTRIGMAGLQSVNVSKRFVVEIDAEKATDDFLSTIASEYLSNPVSEIFEIRPL